jgi:hypothetical protein
MGGTVVITGTFSYTGKYATPILLECEVFRSDFDESSSGTGCGRENPLGDRVEEFLWVHPQFEGEY